MWSCAGRDTPEVGAEWPYIVYRRWAITTPVVCTRVSPHECGHEHEVTGVTRRDAPGMMAIASAALLAASSAAIAAVADGLLGDAFVVVSLFLAIVTLGLLFAALLERGFERRSVGPNQGSNRRRVRRSDPDDCGRCGSPQQERQGIRVCPSCDLGSA